MIGRPISPMEDFDEELENDNIEEESERENFLDITSELRDVNLVATRLERQHTILLLRKVELSAKLSKLESLLKRGEAGIELNEKEDESPPAKRTKLAKCHRKRSDRGKHIYESDKAFTLSPELSSLVGPGKMNRQEVRRKINQLVDERGLHDPVDRDYALCDEELYNVMGIERFRILGMMSYLDKHFLLN